MIVLLTLASYSGPDSFQKNYLLRILALFNRLLQIFDVGIEVAPKVNLKSVLGAVAPIESHHLCNDQQCQLELPIVGSRR